MQPSMLQARDSGRLHPAERFLLWTMRAWVRCCVSGALPAEPVANAFGQIGLPEAASALDAALRGVASTTTRRLLVHWPECPALSNDEWLLLTAVAAAQYREVEGAHRLLGALVPASVARLVLPPLSRLALILASAGIDLPEPSDHLTRDLNVIDSDRMEHDGVRRSGASLRHPAPGQASATLH